VKAEFLAFIQKEYPNLKSEKLLLAHSGGIDSMVLGQLLLEAKIDFAVTHCNFQLRGSASDKDAVFVKKWCQSHSITFFSVRLATQQYGLAHKKNTQLAARELRYNWFFSLLENYGFDRLLTAHHLNDQWETFLINTVRGTGLFGLSGIGETKQILRPLLPFSRAAIQSYAEANALLWREDASNQSDTYVRNALRHHVIPALEQIVPNSLQNFQTTLKHLQDAEEFVRYALDEKRNEVFEEKLDQIHISLQKLSNIAPLSFCLHHWFTPYGFSAVEVHKLMQAQPGKALLSSSHRLIRDREQLLLVKIAIREEESYSFTLTTPSTELPVNWEWKLLSGEDFRLWETTEAALNAALLKFPLTVRKYQKGDYFYPTGMRGKKLLSKFFKDEKYTSLEKEQQWLLCSEDQVVWVVGKRCDRRFSAQADTINLLLIKQL